MFIPRFLVYMTPKPKESLGGVAVPKSKDLDLLFRETHSKLPKDVKPLWAQVGLGLDSIKSDDVSSFIFENTISKIDSIRAKLINGGHFKLLPNLQIVLNALMIRSGLTKKDIKGVLRLTNPYDKNRVFKITKRPPKDITEDSPEKTIVAKAPQLSTLSFGVGELEKVEETMWRAAPGTMIGHYMAANPGKWPEAQIRAFLQKVTAAARYHVYLYAGRGKEVQARLKALRGLFKTIREKKYMGDNKRLEAWLKYNEENYIPSFRLEGLAVAYRGVLKEEAITKYVNDVADLKREVAGIGLSQQQVKALTALEALKELGNLKYTGRTIKFETLKNYGAQNELEKKELAAYKILQKLGLLSDDDYTKWYEKLAKIKSTTKKKLDDWIKENVKTYDTNEIVDELLDASKIPRDGGGKYPKIRAEIYARLLHSVYRAMQSNPNTSYRAREILNKEQQIRRQYGITISLIKPSEGEGVEKPKKSKLKKAGEKAAATLTKGVRPGRLLLPDDPNVDMSGITRLVDKVYRQKDGLIIARDPGKFAKFEGDLAELKKRMAESFGFKYVIQTAVRERNKKRAQAIIDHLEAFAAAYMDSKLLPGYKALLDELSKTKIKGLKPKDQMKRLGELRDLYDDLKNIKFLPTKKDISLREDLYKEAHDLLVKWCALLKEPVRLSGTDSLYYDPDADEGPLDDDSSDFMYSPMIDVELDKTVSTFEIPRSMELQLNRLKMIKTFAYALFGRHKQDFNAPEGFSPDWVIMSLDRIEENITKYYFRKDAGKKYDGKTPFDLKKAIEQDDTVKSFITSMRTFLVSPMRVQVGNTIVAVPSRGYRPPSGEPLPPGVLSPTYTDKQMSSIRVHAYMKEHFKNGADKFFENAVSGNLPYQSSLIKVLDFSSRVGTGDISPFDIKKAGCCISIITREYFGNFVAARDLMSRLLQTHMPASRKKVLRHKRLRDKIQRTTREQAVDARKALAKNGILIQMREALKKKTRKELEERYKGRKPKNFEGLVAHYSDQAFRDWSNRTEYLTKKVLRLRILDRLTLHPFYFTPHGELDEVDPLILAKYRESVGIGGDSDEEKQYKKCIPEIIADIAIEVALVIASIYVPQLALVVMTKRAKKVARIGKLLLRSKRIAGTIRRIKDAVQASARLTKTLKYTARYGKPVLHLLYQGGTFVQMYPMLNNYLGKLMKRPKMETLFDTWRKKPWYHAVLKVLAESAMFGSFHAVSYGAQFLKYGKAGRALHALKAHPNAKVAKEASAVLNTVGAMKNAKAGQEAVKKLLDSGKLSKPVEAALRRAGTDIGQLQAKYFRLIKGVKDSKLRRVLGFMIQDLGFDMVAMILGTIVKHKVYRGDEEELKLTNADTLFRMYTMGFAFRASFGAIPRATQAIMKRLGAKSPIDAFEMQTGEVAKIEKARDKALKPHDRAVRLFEEQNTELARKIRRLKPGKEKLDALTQQAKLQPEIKKAKEARDATERNYDEALKEANKELKYLGKVIKDPELADWPVPSAIARILPRPVRIHLYRHYKLGGVFLGSNGFADLCVTDFAVAHQMMFKAKRSILSPSEVIHVAMKLDPINRSIFLAETGRLMTPKQHYVYQQMVRRMSPLRPKEYGKLPKDLDVPKEIRSPRKRKSYRWHKLRTLLLAGVGLTMAAMVGGCSSRSGEVTRRGKVEFVQKDFKKGGELHQSPREFEGFREASKNDPVTIVKCEVKESGYKKGHKLHGDESTLHGMAGVGKNPHAKAYHGQLPSNFFVPALEKHEKNIQSMIDALEEMGVAKPTLFAIKNTLNKLDKKAKRFVSFKVSEKKGGKGETNVTVYLVIDQENYAKDWAKRTGKPVNEAPWLLESLKAQGIVESSTYDDVGRWVQNRSFYTGFTLMMYGAAYALLIGQRRRRPSKISTAYDRLKWSPSPAGSKLPWKILRTLFWNLPKAAIWFTTFPFLAPMERAGTVVSREQIPALETLVNLNQLTDPQLRRSMEGSYRDLIGSDFFRLRFRTEGAETVKQVSLNVFRELIRGRFNEFRMRQIEMDLANLNGVDPAHQPRITRLQREWVEIEAMLHNSFTNLNSRFLGLETGGRNPFALGSMLRPGGQRRAADVLSWFYKLNNPNVPAHEVLAFRREATKGFRTLSTILGEPGEIHSALVELVRLNRAISRNQTRYTSSNNLRNQYLDANGNVLPARQAEMVADRTLREQVYEADAFCRTIEAMRLRRDGRYRYWQNVMARINRFTGQAANAAYTNRPARFGAALLAGLGWGIVKAIFPGEKYEELEKEDGNLMLKKSPTGKGTEMKRAKERKGAKERGVDVPDISHGVPEPGKDAGAKRTKGGSFFPSGTQDAGTSLFGKPKSDASAAKPAMKPTVAPPTKKTMRERLQKALNNIDAMVRPPSPPKK